MKSKSKAQLHKDALGARFMHSRGAISFNELSPFLFYLAVCIQQRLFGNSRMPDYKNIAGSNKGLITLRLHITEIIIIFIHLYRLVYCCFSKFKFKIL